MTLSELTGKLQNLCHDGHSLDEVLIDLDGCNETYAEIEVRKVMEKWIDVKIMTERKSRKKPEVA